MMSREKERLRRLVSCRRSEDRCRLRRPCCNVLAAGVVAGVSPRMPRSLAAVAAVPPVAALSEVGGSSLGGRTPASGPGRGSGVPGWGASPCRAASSFRLRSYSSSWPKKLKLGEMDGRRSFTNLGRSSSVGRGLGSRSAPQPSLHPHDQPQPSRQCRGGRPGPRAMRDTCRHHPRTCPWSS